MVSSVEMVLWAIHHATTLLFGVFASAALCGIEINRRHALELVLVGAVTGCAFGLANAVGGELFARQVYPLVVHLPQPILRSRTIWRASRPHSPSLPSCCIGPATSVRAWRLKAPPS